jgi:hypothetical protein
MKTYKKRAKWGGQNEGGADSVSFNTASWRATNGGVMDPDNGDSSWLTIPPRAHYMPAEPPASVDVSATLDVRIHFNTNNVPTEFIPPGFIQSGVANCIPHPFCISFCLTNHPPPGVAGHPPTSASVSAEARTKYPPDEDEPVTGHSVSLDETHLVLDRHGSAKNAWKKMHKRHSGVPIWMPL